jgi:CheY-like chemotaxis protein
MSRKRILLVEDEMLIALDIEATLHQLGHEVFSATTVAEALKHLEHGVDLAILDFQLKAGDTTDLAHNLRDLGIPFVVCSGNISLDDLGAAFAGASFLPKPFSAAGLLDAVARAGTNHLAHA